LGVDSYPLKILFGAWKLLQEATDGAKVPQRKAETEKETKRWRERQKDRDRDRNRDRDRKRQKR
jgi:hypothetical protein